MTDREVMQQALDAWDDPAGMKDLCVAMDTLRTALKQQAEPVAQRKPLTDEEVVEVLGNLRESIAGNVFLAFARAIEAAHNIKEGT